MTNNNAAPDQVITSAENFLASGKISDAQNLLVDEGYVKRSEPKIQEAYLRLIPVGPTLREVLDEMYEGLNNPNPKLRFKAVTQIARELNKERLRGKVRWMRDPRASEPLIKAASDPDAKVSERALGTLTRLVCKYFPDQRALPTFLMKLTDQNQNIRSDAISGIACLRREDVLVHLVTLLDNGTDRDRSEVARQISGLAYETWNNLLQYPIQWTRNGKRFWKDKMIKALRDPHLEVRKQAALALKHFGDRDVLPAVEAARRTERDEDTAFYMDDAIEALKARG